MPQSLAKVIVHIIFSTKSRMACLTPAVRGELHRYASAVLKNLGCPAIKLGGTEDHVHILCVLSRNLSVAKLVEEVKKPTSKWLKSKGVAFSKFHWQNGYGAFSVSQSDIKRVREYIANQEEHHRKMTFQEEFRRFLAKFEVMYDEAYVWD